MAFQHTSDFHHLCFLSWLSRRSPLGELASDASKVWKDSRPFLPISPAATVGSCRPLSKVTISIGIEFKDNPPALNVAERLICEPGWSGVANIDMQYDARHNFPVVLELNGRFWFSSLGSLNAGVNFPLLMCEICLGELRANRIPHRARYFSGWYSILLSLLGGGTFRIRPHETNLRYLDLLPFAIWLARSAVASVWGPFLRMFAGFTGSR